MFYEQITHTTHTTKLNILILLTFTSFDPSFLSIPLNLSCFFELNLEDDHDLDPWRMMTMMLLLNLKIVLDSAVDTHCKPDDDDRLQQAAVFESNS